jgi:hypothetical protein
MTPRREEDDEQQFDDFEEEPLSSWAAIRRFLRTLSTKVQKLNVDVYAGRDAANPSVTTRLDRLERSMGLLIRIMWALATVSLSSLAAVIIQLIGKLVHP